VTAPPIIYLEDLRPDGQTEAELRWVFNEADGDMGVRSNFMPMVARIQCPRDAAAVTSYEADWRQVEAASRDKVIRQALERVGGGKARVLELAYTELSHDAAQRLEPLGRVAGVVLALPATIAAHAKSQTDRPLVEWLGRIAKRSASVTTRGICAPLTREAEALFFDAVAAYRKARGKARR
jgi:hypothetical protein